MSGRPPSNGCEPCKKRRKKCDLTQPVCSRCARLNSDCQYVARSWRFIDATTSTRHRLVIKTTALSAKPDITATNLSFANAITSQIRSIFWQQYLPVQLDGKSSDLAAIAHFLSFRALAETNTILRDALDAVAMLCVSQQKDDERLLYRGSCLYVKTIGNINQALQQPGLATSDAVLASCRTIAFYEMFRPAHQNSAQRDDWIKHVWGIASIVRLRQQMTKSSALPGIHSDARALAGHCAMRTRSPAILNCIAVQPSTLQDSVTDCIAMLVTWLEQHDRHLTEEVYMHGLQVLESLRGWEDVALAVCGVSVPPEDVQKRCTTLLAAARSAGHRIWFVVMQYWSTVLIATSQLRFTWNYLRLLGAYLPVPPNPAPYAHHMALSTSDLFAEDAGLWTVEQILLPVSAAVCYYAAIDAGGSWPAMQLQAAFVSRKNAIFAKGFLRDIKEDEPSNAMKLKTAAAREWYHLPDIDEIWRLSPP